MQKAWGHTQLAVPDGGYFFLLYKANVFFLSFFFFFFPRVGEEVGLPSAVFSLIVEFDTLEARNSVSFLTAIPQPYSHSFPTHCCSTDTS